MFLKRLDLHGFKSFASRAHFDFNGGVTAIVGPNGSGKSNVADAVRWVLGEQSGRLLRARRLEDVIFAGSSDRPQLGMAEVSLTFDNSSGRLPIEFTEVVVSRRAHRSGESEFFLNRSRVRLKDVVDLLLRGQVGHSDYTVVGQGLIDSMLSLKPEERREVLEDAADVRRYRLSLHEAQERLLHTRENLERAGLVLQELEPRLTQLRRQARRAEEQERLTRELGRVLGTLHARCIHDAGQRAQQARAHLEAAELSRDERAAAHDNAQSRLAAVRREAAERRTALEAGRREREERVARLQQLSKEVEIGETRLAFFDRQEQGLAQELESLRAELGEASAKLYVLHSETDELGGAATAAERAATALQQRLAEQQQRRDATVRALREAQAERTRHQARLVAAEERLTTLGRREEELQASLQAWVVEREQLIGQLRAERDALNELLADERLELGHIEQADSSREEALQQLARARGDEARHELELQRLETERDRFQMRLDMLSAAGASGMDEGVRAVLEASGKWEGGASLRDKGLEELPLHSVPPGQTGARLKGIVGALGNLIKVPAGLEVAIEAALEGHLHDVIVEREGDAEAAIAFLQRVEGGRATFFPLDGPREERPVNIAREHGIVGVASNLVKCEGQYRPLVDALLGRTIVVDDLATARRVLRRRLGSAVTRAGELLRPIGTISGGRRPREADRSLVARSRELLELPVRIAECQERRERVEAAAASARAARERADDQVKTIERQRQAIEVSLQEARARLQEKRIRVGVQRQEAKWRVRRGREMAAELDDVVARAAEMREQMRGWRSASEDGVQSLEEELRKAESELASIGGALGEEKASLAGSRARAESALRAHRERAAAAERIGQQMESKQGQGEALSREREETRTRLEAARQALEALRPGGEARPEECQDRLTALEKEERELTGMEESVRQELIAAERKLAEAEAECRRGDEAAEGARAAAEADGVSVGSLPEPAAGKTAEELRRRRDGVRAQLRALGPVNAEALTDYEEMRSRHESLRGQVEDLRAGERSLLEAIGELEGVIRSRFEEAFRTIGESFAHYFEVFFGGGTARLSLVEDDGGVEIFAQPPGKRLQNLGVLSGGERALTSMALLFAILRRNPVPFCVLDEVDAALDEANIGRFVAALRELARDTQFIIITHNRRTIEIADAIYGVSMGPDSVSRLLSLRLERNGDGEPALKPAARARRASPPEATAPPAVR